MLAAPGWRSFPGAAGLGRLRSGAGGNTGLRRFRVIGSKEDLEKIKFRLIFSTGRAPVNKHSVGYCDNYISV